MKKFCDREFPDQKFRNDTARKQFLLNKGLRLQKDDKGVYGVVQAKEGHEDSKEIRIGKRLSSSKIKQENFSDRGREERDAAHRKNSQNLHVQSNSKAGRKRWLGSGE